MVPLFEETRKTVNHSIPYKQTGSTRGCRPAVVSVDLLGMALYYLKSRDVLYKICPVFGLVPSSLHVWLDFASEVLLKTVTRRMHAEFESQVAK